MFMPECNISVSNCIRNRQGNALQENIQTLKLYMMARKSESNTFLNISVCLTGFSEMELLSTGMVDTYFNVMMNQSNIATAEAFLNEAADLLKKYKDDPAKLQDAINGSLMPASMYSGIAQNIIRMWYLGNWGNTVIAPQTYVQGLIWGVAGTHPPGAKQPGYASWNTAPIDMNNH